MKENPKIWLGHKDNTEDIPSISLLETIRYLGVPIGGSKFSRFKYADDKVDNIIKEMIRVGRSGLKVTQQIFAIKTYILPKIDYLMYNSIIKLTCLQKLDKAVRKILGEIIGCPSLSKSYFYTGWKDGGFGIPNMELRYHVCKIVNIMQLKSGSIETRRMIDNEIAEFSYYNRMDLSDNRNSFFGFCYKEDIRYHDGGYSSIVAEAYRSCKKVDILARQDEENLKEFFIEDLRLIKDYSNDVENKKPKKFTCKKGTHIITKILQKRFLEMLLDQPSEANLFTL